MALFPPAGTAENAAHGRIPTLDKAARRERKTSGGKRSSRRGDRRRVGSADKARVCSRSREQTGPGHCEPVHRGKQRLDPERRLGSGRALMLAAAGPAQAGAIALAGRCARAAAATPATAERRALVREHGAQERQDRNAEENQECEERLRGHEAVTANRGFGAPSHTGLLDRQKPELEDERRATKRRARCPAGRILGTRNGSWQP